MHTTIHVSNRANTADDDKPGAAGLGRWRPAAGLGTGGGLAGGRTTAGLGQSWRPAEGLVQRRAAACLGPAAGEATGCWPVDGGAWGRVDEADDGRRGVLLQYSGIGAPPPRQQDAGD